MPVYTDQLGRDVLIDYKPQSIVSIVPSQTELLYDLELDNEVTGITKFCIHPPQWFQNKTRIGGTKTLNIARIRSLNPQLIIANKEENVQEQVESLAKEFPVWISDISTLQDALVMIEQVGAICGRTEKALTIKNTIASSFENKPGCVERLKTVYLIWKDPYMTVGGDTFINNMLGYAGFENIYSGKTRYPQINIEQLQNDNPEVLLLSSEPYPFRQKNIDELKQLLPTTKILLVDGELFSWYGSRLIHAAAYFYQLRNELTSMA